MLMEMGISKKKEMLSMGLFFIIALKLSLSLSSNFEYLYLFHFKYTSHTLPATKTRLITGFLLFENSKISIHILSFRVNSEIRYYFIRI